MVQIYNECLKAISKIEKFDLYTEITGLQLLPFHNLVFNVFLLQLQ